MLLRPNLLLLRCFVRILWMILKDLCLISKHDTTLKGCVQNVEHRALETYLHLWAAGVDCYTGTIVLNGYPVFDDNS